MSKHRPGNLPSGEQSRYQPTKVGFAFQNGNSLPGNKAARDEDTQYHDSIANYATAT
jgi:hypothetical protein